uniref:Uncharacterized protein n=1 Tax=viral metagenome TaxID=1070528 RepID=A0A6H1ZES9_9ZZZZ
MADNSIITYYEHGIMITRLPYVEPPPDIRYDYQSYYNPRTPPGYHQMRDHHYETYTVVPGCYRRAGGASA